MRSGKSGCKRPDKFLRATRVMVAADRPPRKAKVCRGGAGERIREGRRSLCRIPDPWDDPEDVYFDEPIEWPEGPPEGWVPPDKS